MRRAERLFQLVQLVRGRRLSTAAWLAQRLEVSERTVYRDVAELQHQGVPLDGEAGVGYRMRAGFDLPPLMFSTDEAQALVAAMRLASGQLDPGLARAGEQALSKILSVLPSTARAAADSLALFAPGAGLDDATRLKLGLLRQAVADKRKLALRYRDLAGQRSQRTVRPVACLHWGAVWTLAAWCELRQGFRSFRVDLIEQAQVLEQRFRDEPGRSLADLWRHSGAPPGG